METREASGLKGERALTQDTNHVRCPGPTDSMPRQVTPSRPCSLEACNCAGLGQADRAEPRTQKQPYTGMNTCPRTDRGNHRRPFSKCHWTHIRPRTPGSVSVHGHGSLCSNRPNWKPPKCPSEVEPTFLLWRIHTMRQCTLVKMTGDSYMRQGQINLMDIMVSKKGCQIEGNFIGRASYQIRESVENRLNVFSCASPEYRPHKPLPRTLMFYHRRKPSVPTGRQALPAVHTLQPPAVTS